jgi:PBP1b-binding outer membrane lipoprotein LpoB
MRAAVETLALLALALAACSETEQQESVNNAAATEIEALPPDESVEPPPEEPDGDAEPSTENAAQY